jgi:serine/threonine-protein kinase
VDGRADLYSAGVILYEMLTGRRPFEYDSAEALLSAHLREPPPAFAARGVDGVAPAVEAVVHACLAKAPDQRPRDAAELARRYEQSLGRPLAPRRPRSTVLRVPVVVPPGQPARTPPLGAPGTLRQDFEADMPEAVALLKLKGFLHDLGAEVVESVPGMIRVRLGQPDAPKKKSGLFALLDRAAPRTDVLPAAPATDLELHMHRRDPARPNWLSITLLMRPRSGPASAEWRTRCQKIGTDLRAYLMGS